MREVLLLDVVASVYESQKHCGPSRSEDVYRLPGSNGGGLIGFGGLMFRGLGV